MVRAFAWLLVGGALLGCGPEASSRAGERAVGNEAGAGGAGGAAGAGGVEAGGGAGAGGVAVGGSGGWALAGAAGAAGRGEGGRGGCAAVAAGAFELRELSALRTVVVAPLSPGQESAVIGDEVELSLYAYKSGEIALGEGGNAAHATCEQCLVAVIDRGGPLEAHYFQAAGSLVVDGASNPAAGRVKASLDGVRLVEVITSPMGAVSPIVGGRCLELARADIDVSAPEVSCLGATDCTAVVDAVCDPETLRCSVEARCQVTADCDGERVCVPQPTTYSTAGACHDVCRSDGDCREGFGCQVLPANDVGVCLRAGATPALGACRAGPVGSECERGAVCVTDPGTTTGTCRTVCDPLADAPGCPAPDRCVSLGVCVAPGAETPVTMLHDVKEGEECPVTAAAGMCADDGVAMRGICISGAGTPRCRLLCDARRGPCDGGECIDLAAQGQIGACVPPCGPGGEVCEEGLLCIPSRRVCLAAPTLAAALGEPCKGGGEGAFCALADGSAGGICKRVGKEVRCEPLCEWPGGEACAEGERCRPFINSPIGTCTGTCDPAAADSCSVYEICAPQLGCTPPAFLATDPASLGEGCAFDHAFYFCGVSDRVARGQCSVLGGATAPRCTPHCRVGVDECPEGLTCARMPLGWPGWGVCVVGCQVGGEGACPEGMACSPWGSCEPACGPLSCRDGYSPIQTSTEVGDPCVVPQAPCALSGARFEGLCVEGVCRRACGPDDVQPCAQGEVCVSLGEGEEVSVCRAGP